ncbi:CDP-diacylglycerol--serine O-phosphatidyltransferase [Rhizobium sp. BK313]|uniref:CDP-alcohol phosphatidyltransferase family protein n=1 Tax=Rhizobium sp. BK313 TaxID=2587081 RepID=UPI00105BFFB9|nr:CDP-alcohol phosphatidyltransferase family protein [Rhizobium sp. BK313]MBB3458814.1 CDP-diacylglycerol--serine O-phosphatidyltransferase [Rhizobium sp. BK313]
MLVYLRDPANAITAVGIAVSATALVTLISGRIEMAVALGLWSVLADQIDGVVAGKTRNRNADAAKVGKYLDGFGDMVYGATLPALVIVAATQHAAVAHVLAVALLLAGALRLSYFSVFGLSGGSFYGVPLSYDIPLLSLFLLARSSLPAAAFTPVITLSFAVMAILHIAPIRVPAPRGAALVAIAAVCIVLSAALFLKSLWLGR